MGSKGGTAPSVSTIQAANPTVPGEATLNSAANWVEQKGAPYISSPWRAIDYYRNDKTPTSYVPQFNPGASGNLSAASGTQATGNPTPGMGGGAQQAGAGVNPAASFWTGQGPITQGTLPQNQTSATVPVPTANAQQGMLQNISPSLAGLGQLLAGILGANQPTQGGMPLQPTGPPPGPQPTQPTPAGPDISPLNPQQYPNSVAGGYPVFSPQNLPAGTGPRNPLGGLQPNQLAADQQQYAAFQAANPQAPASIPGAQQ